MDSYVRATQKQFLTFVLYVCMYVCATSDCREERERLLVGIENHEAAFL